jgi:hypothetical protein
MVQFIIYGTAALSFQEYVDFTRRAKWKKIRGENGCRNMGYYLNLCTRGDPKITGI